MKKRILSSLLALCMILTLLPTMAFAATETSIKETEIQPAHLVDQKGEVTELTSRYNVTATETAETNSFSVKIVAEDLKVHTNADGQMGRWIGFSVKAPDGVTKFKYSFGTAKAEPGDTIYTIEKNVDGYNNDGVAFYADASAATPNTYASLQWLDENEAAVSPVTYFQMDLSEVKFYSGLPATNVTSAKLEDHAGSNPLPSKDLYSTLKCEPSGSGRTIASNKIVEILLTATGLKKHTNAEGTQGYWIGMAVIAPAGATQVKYAFSANEAGVSTLSDPMALETNVSSDGKDGIAFYANAEDKGTAKTYCAVQFLNASGEAVTEVVKLKMNLDNVQLASDTPTPETATVTFNLNYTGAPDATTKEVTKGETLGENMPSDPSRTGFTFAGWWVDVNYGPEFKSETVVDENMTVWAKWEPTTESEKVTVYFITDPTSTVYHDIQKVDAGGKATRPADPAKVGYVFQGWYTSEDFVNQWNFETDSVGTAATCLIYAKWQYVGVPVVPPTDTGNNGNGNANTTVTNPDGSTTTTKTDANGTVTETTKAPDGTKTEVVTKPDGSQTTDVRTPDGMTSTTVVDAYGQVEAEVSLPKKVADAAAESGETVALPMPPVYAGSSAATAPVVSVDLPNKTGAVAVEIPVARPSAGTVAVIVYDDGTEEIVKTSVSTDTGVVVVLDGDATIKIVDNTKQFVDKPYDWSTDSIDFVTSRELFNGTSATTFSPEATMTREMLMTVLARLDGADTTGDALAKGMAWAVSVGISDGSDPAGKITREQLAVMLYRYAGQPVTYGSVGGFADADAVSGFAADAMTWAVENGIINGMDGKLNPQGSATRAQVAAMLQRFVEQ